MRLIIRFIGSAMVVSVLAAVIPGISISGFGSALFLVVVLTVLNLLVKPVLVLLTIPVTLLTFGLFLLVINAVIILWPLVLLLGSGLTDLLLLCCFRWPTQLFPIYSL